MLITIEDVLLFAYIYVFCFLGAFSKDMLDTFLDKIPKVLILKVLISSLSVAILLYGFSEHILEKLSFKVLTSICYIFGILSFECMEKYSNIREVLELVDEFKIWTKNKKQG